MITDDVFHDCSSTFESGTTVKVAKILGFFSGCPAHAVRGGPSRLEPANAIEPHFFVAILNEVSAFVRTRYQDNVHSSDIGNWKEDMKILEMEAKPVDILLVEDNPVDVMMTKEAFNSARVCNTLHVTEDGEEAMDFLLKQGKYADAPTPDIILLDLNLPRKDGREVLAEIKNDPSLRHIPVIILTTSESPEDIATSYELLANCFVTKPVDMDQFTNALECLGEFWFTIVRLPPGA